MNLLRFTPPLPKKILICILLTYALPSMLIGELFIFSGAITFKEFCDVITGPVALPFMFLMWLIGFVFYKNFSKKYYSYDGSAESASVLSSSLRLLYKTSIFMPLFLYMLEPLVYQINNDARGIVFTAFNGKSLYPLWYCGLMGLTMLCSQIFVLLTVHFAEKHLSCVPYTKDSQTFSLMFRILYTSLMTTAGLVLIILSIFTIPANMDIPIYRLLISKVMPLSVLAMAVLALVCYINVRDIKTGMNSVQAFSRRLSEKDYTMQPLLVTCRCEIGELSRNMNIFFENTKDILKGIKENVAVTQETADVLSKDIKEASENVLSITGGIDSIRGQMKNQSQSVDDAGNSVAQISNKISDLQESVATQSKAVEQSSAVVNEMVSNIESITATIKENEKAVSQLVAASDEGKKIVLSAVETAEAISNDSDALLEASKIIQNIASQTNLLAMNAAIEAAHAGDVGKGFSVVADEIRKLAEQSNFQGKSINESLKKLSGSIENVAAATRKVQDEFDRIYELSALVKNQESTIYAAVLEQNEGNRQVIDAIRDITVSASTVKAGTEEMYEGNKLVSQEMRNLKDMTIRINGEMDDMSKGIERISYVMNNVSGKTSENAGGMAALGGELNKFSF